MRKFIKEILLLEVLAPSLITPILVLFVFPAPSEQGIRHWVTIWLGVMFLIEIIHFPTKLVGRKGKYPLFTVADELFGMADEIKNPSSLQNRALSQSCELVRAVVKDGDHLTAQKGENWTAAMFLMNNIMTANDEMFNRNSNHIKRHLSIANDHLKGVAPGPDAFEDVYGPIFRSYHNICALSTNTPYMWDNPTFLMFLLCNASRAVEKGLDESDVPPPRKFKVSPEVKPKPAEQFLMNEKSVLTNLANQNNDAKFFAIRFFVYGDGEYEDSEKSLTQLIRAHRLFGMHAIALVTQPLYEKFEAPAIEIIKKINIEISRVYNIRTNVRQIPDCLLIDGGTTHARFFIHNGNKILGGSPDAQLLSAAYALFSLLAKLGQDRCVRWQRDDIDNYKWFGIQTPFSEFTKCPDCVVPVEPPGG